MKGIGGSTIEEELSAIEPRAHLVKPIAVSEYKQRISKVCELMRQNKLDVLYLNAGTNLLYFTGTKWNPSERMVGAMLFSNEELIYICPEFEKGTILDFMGVTGTIAGWEEHESPYSLFVNLLSERSVKEGKIAIDEAAPFFLVDGILKTHPGLTIINAKSITSACRMIKSDAEIAIIKAAMDITLEVQKAAARVLRVGISSKEMVDFIHEAHKRFGITSGSYFCIVLFGVDTAFPHGVKKPKALEANEMVIIDTGCMLQNYISDITRTYVFGESNELQQRIWAIEKEAQLVAFNASQIGNTCESIDIAVHKNLELHGLGPDYQLPGLPHRTGHGIGLDIHEWPYIVRNDKTVLATGMCFSIEPMICVPGKFGIRHEDHIYMTKEGPKWFTEPSHSIENPFGI